MKPILSGKASLIVGAIGMALLTAAAFVPMPWSVPVGLAGLLGAGLGGLAAPTFKFAAGAPKLQGSLFAIAGVVGGVLEQLWPTLPETWRAVALPAIGLIAWLTGRAMPPLGAESQPSAIELPPIKDASSAAAALNEKGPNP